MNIIKIILGYILMLLLWPFPHFRKIFAKGFREGVTNKLNEVNIRIWTSEEGEWKWEFVRAGIRLAFGDSPSFLDAQQSVLGAWKSVSR